MSTSLREQVVGLYTANPVIVAAALPLLAWVALFHVADAAQTVAAFVLRAYRIATLPLLVYAVALWGVGLGGGYLAAFDARPASARRGCTARAASGRWRRSASSLPPLGLTALLACKLRRERAVSSRPPAAGALPERPSARRRPAGSSITKRCRRRRAPRSARCRRGARRSA